jgi:putative hydrolase of the HAD superfamily
VLAILTDGRSITQRLKLRSLGLQELPAFVSEDFGSEKPEPLRYQRIMEQWPGNRYCYVGDNPHKDFLAPNSLGWTTICLRDDGRNIHPQRVPTTSGHAPHHWLDQLEQITDLLR